MSNLQGEIASVQELSGDMKVQVAPTSYIEVNKVTTLPTGANATVELDETSTKLNPKFNFGIPQGQKGDAGSIKFIIANELPTENIDESAIYMKASTNPDTQNTYEEYIYVNGSWESLGTAQVEVDLTDYQKATELEERPFEITYEDGTTEILRSVVYK